MARHKVLLQNMYSSLYTFHPLYCVAMAQETCVAGVLGIVVCSRLFDRFYRLSAVSPKAIG